MRRTGATVVFGRNVAVAVSGHEQVPRSAVVGHPVFARLYARYSPASEHRGSASHRRRMLAGLSGRVIEVGCGNGLNFAHYPTEVAQVVGVEPERYLRTVARVAAARSSVLVEVVDGRAERMPFADGTFDAAVTSLVLCSVADPVAALAEIRRVLRPGGQLRFYEHVRSPSDTHARLQRILSPAWQALGGGCHPDRDTATSIEAAGFAIQHQERFCYRPGPRVPLGLISPHILGRATVQTGPSSPRSLRERS